MMFIVRTRGERPAASTLGPDVRIALTRATPSLVAEQADQIDLFCVGDESAAERLQGEGWNVVPLCDGWYQGDDEGGVAIWGQGLYWEVRDTPFRVKEAVGPASDPATSGDDSSEINVRRAVFGV